MNPARRRALTPEALEMMDAIARTGSFAAAARELGKVPSALTYSVRQLEESLDALLFDRRSRQAQFTPAGEELLREGRLLLSQMGAVANRVQRVAAGWETMLSVALDVVIAPAAVYDLVDAFYALRVAVADQSSGDAMMPPPTRLRLRHEVMAGTWEALLSGEVDLAVGALSNNTPRDSIQLEEIGSLQMVMAVAPHHPLAQAPEPVTQAVLALHRVVTIADSARRMEPMTFGVVPGQDVLTVPSLGAKLEAQLRGLGCGRLPEPLARRHVEAGRLVIKQTEHLVGPMRLFYAWRRQAQEGRALAWWLEQLRSPTTRRALLEQHAGFVL